MTTPSPHSPMNPSPRPGQPPHDADAGHQRLDEARMWNAVAYLISGPVIYGAIGWGLDAWLGTSWLVAVGILGGMALSLYVVWVRYGTQ